MVSEERFNSLVERVYDAALNEAEWRETLGEIAVAFGGVGAVMHDLSGTPPLVSISPSLASMVEDYLSGWVEQDSLIAAGRELNIGPGIYVDTDLLGDELRKRDPFFHDFLHPGGIGGVLSLVTAPYGDSTYTFNVQRSVTTGPVYAEERRQFARLGRHLTRAAAMASRLARATSVGSALAERLDDFDCATAVLDGTGRVVMANAAMHRLELEGLRIRAGRLTLPGTSAQARLDRLIHDATQPVASGKGPDTLTVARPSNLLPLLIRVTPIAPATAERHFGTISARGALLTVLNPDHPKYPAVTKALCALGLTPAQARIAVLIGGGQTVRETAEQLLLSEETVRTTLKHVFYRLGISRQVELAILVSRAVPFER